MNILNPVIIRIQNIKNNPFPKDPINRENISMLLVIIIGEKNANDVIKPVLLTSINIYYKYKILFDIYIIKPQT
jgi:hypothetical protein